jgi:hypothetical protein
MLCEPSHTHFRDPHTSEGAPCTLIMQCLGCSDILVLKGEGEDASPPPPLFVIIRLVVHVIHEHHMLHTALEVGVQIFGAFRCVRFRHV